MLSLEPPEVLTKPACWQYISYCIQHHITLSPLLLL
jgi:hypothetical protein